MARAERTPPADPAAPEVSVLVLPAGPGPGCQEFPAQQYRHWGPPCVALQGPDPGGPCSPCVPGRLEKGSGSKDEIGRKYWGLATTGGVSRTKEEEGLVGGEMTDTSD